MPNNEKPYQGDHKAPMQQISAKAWTGQPYPAYKDSGVEWLGQVPKHWEVRRLGTFGQFLKGNGGTKADETAEGVPCVRYGDLYTKHQFHITESKSCIAPHRAMAYTPINYGDVLFAGSGETLEEIGKSAVNLIRELAVCGGDVIIFRPTLELDAEFIGWSMDCQQAVSQKAQMGRGITVMHIYSNDLKYLAVALPPLPEQHAIAHFLDHATQRIQHHIHAKQKLIKLLEEQKQVIIHQEAVTGQINVQTGQPYPVYKDSGIEWLGEVPEHWEMRRARYIFREVDRRSRDGVGQHLSMSQRLGLVPSHLVENRTLVSESYAGGKLCDVGDLVLNRLKAHLGVFACAHHEGIVSPDYTVLRLKKTGIMEYFEQTLRSSGYRTELRIRAKGIVEGFWRLYTDDFNEIRIPVPPDLEQARIAAWIRSVADYTHRLAASYNRHIDLLHEYRTRLISDVVTGKLDVREAAAHLPESNLPTVAANCQDGTELADRGRSPHP